MERSRDGTDLRVLMISGEWPSASFPGVSPSVARMTDVVRLAGGDVEPFEFRGSMQPQAYRRARAAIRAHAGRDRFDIVHAHHVQCGLVAASCGLPLVVSLDERDLQGLSRIRSVLARAATLRLSRWVARRAAAVIVPSESSARRLVSTDRVRVVPSGVDLELFRPGSKIDARRELDMRADRKLVLYAGDPHAPWASYVVAVDAIADLRARFDVTLMMADREPPSTVALYLQACDALLVSSGSEAASLMLNQALACRTPVVLVGDHPTHRWAADLPGVRTSPDERVRSVATVLEQLLTSPPVDDDGRRLVEERLDDRRMGEELIAVYRNVLGVAVT